jgi:hypothetical protein
MDISVKYNGPELAGEFSAARIGIAQSSMPQLRLLVEGLAVEHFRERKINSSYNISSKEL